MPQDTKPGMKNGMKDSSAPSVPKNYQPTDIQTRNQWNNFLRYLYNQGNYGNTSLDTGQDKTADLINNFKKVDPSFNITPQQVPSIQYEIYMMRNGMIPNGDGTFVKNTNPVLQSSINSIYNGKPVSPVDGRIGSMTSQETYPVVNVNGQSFGVDYNKFMSDYNSITANNSSFKQGMAQNQ